jgi:hypothetical protein
MKCDQTALGRHVRILSHSYVILVNHGYLGGLSEMSLLPFNDGA